MKLIVERGSKPSILGSDIPRSTVFIGSVKCHSHKEGLYVRMANGEIAVISHPILKSGDGWSGCYNFIFYNYAVVQQITAEV